jgi:hypothetical protein
LDNEQNALHAGVSRKENEAKKHKTPPAGPFWERACRIADFVLGWNNYIDEQGEKGKASNAVGRIFCGIC